MFLQNTLRRFEKFLRIARSSEAPEQIAKLPADRVLPAPMHIKLAANMEILANGHGQLLTFDTHLPVDNYGNALPWFTYPAIEYLRRFDCSGWRVFEYGAGQSTIYWSHRGALITSVEHNEQWFTEMTQKQLPNSQIVHRTDPEQYADAIRLGNERFKVIIIDGVWREICAERCTKYLSDDGFLILDNSDWYHEAASRIRKKGFLEVSFSGFGPVNDYTWTTSLFFRTPAGYQYDLSPPDPIGGNRLGPDAVDKWW